ncbi:MAG: hypothetical protein ACTS6P_01530 [Candidatus Hodgkinia cicadicola]
MIWRLTYVNNCRLQVNIAAIDGTMGTFGFAKWGTSGSTVNRR